MSGLYQWAGHSLRVGYKQDIIRFGSLLEGDICKAKKKWYGKMRVDLKEVICRNERRDGTGSESCLRRGSVESTTVAKWSVSYVVSTYLMCLLVKMLPDVDTFVMRTFYSSFFFAYFILRIPFFVSVFTFTAKNNCSKMVELVVSVTLCAIF